MSPDIELIATKWRSAVIVCRKCSKKLHGGFGLDGKRDFSRVLKEELRRADQHRTTRIVESKCLGLCPKNGVAVIPAQNPGTMLSVPAGADLLKILAKLQPA